jgi:hypothetical protein
MELKLMHAAREYQQGYNDCLDGRPLESARGTFDEVHWNLYRAGFLGSNAGSRSLTPLACRPDSPASPQLGPRLQGIATDKEKRTSRGGSSESDTAGSIASETYPPLAVSLSTSDSASKWLR